MFKYTAKYTDFNGVEKQRDLYFNMSKADLTTLELSVPGGMYAVLTTIVNAKDNVEIVKMLDLLLEKSFGIKSPDGETFSKGPEIYRAFREHAAYDVFFDWLSDADHAAEFVNAIVPQGVIAEMDKIQDQIKSGEILNGQISTSEVTPIK